MRLKTIKLAGFKSFVDATKVHFEQQMTAIVGPNGCGKSNIIDAVRWVLGESSAKHLRGEAMTDVIFNGATGRQAVGQASVELVFDNSGRHSVRAASVQQYNEISVRRLVNRDGVNQYFLNGSKCRRRDITDIFLGTGLGPRSYAIIEQGTISRLIESKPQELRVFIEEAAGISKYKERRRETEQRIAHTRENLQRLQDIATELTLHIDKLFAQAEAATRFTELKGRERQLKAELCAYRWQQNQLQLQQAEQEIVAASATLQQLSQQQQQDELGLQSVELRLGEIQQMLSEQQPKQLQLAQQVVRLEQEIKYQGQAADDNKAALLLLSEKIADNFHAQQQERSAQQQYQDSLKQQQRQLATLQAQVQSLNEQLAQYKQSREQLEREYGDSQQQQQRYLEARQRVNTEIAVQQQTLAQLCSRREQVRATSHDEPDDESPHCVLPESLQAQLAQLDERKQNLQQQLTQGEHGLGEKQQAIADGHRQQAVLTAEIAMLQRRQRQIEQHLGEILPAQGPQHTPLHEHLGVDAGWEVALEVVLQHWLTAPLLDAKVESLLSEVAEQISVRWLLTVDGADNKASAVADSLAQKVHWHAGINATLQQQLNHIHCVATPEQARARLSKLQAGESVICPDGSWYGVDFIVKGLDSGQERPLSLRAESDGITEQLMQLQCRLNEKSTQLQQHEQNLLVLQSMQQQRQQQLSSLAEQQHRLSQQLALQQQRQQHLDEKKQRLQAELQQLDAEISAATQQLNERQLALAELDSSRPTQQHEALLSALHALKQQIDDIQALQQASQTELHQRQLAVAREEHQLQHSEQSLNRLLQQEQQYLEQQQQLQQQQQDAAILSEARQQLQRYQSEKQQLDSQLVQASDEAKQCRGNIAALQQSIKATSANMAKTQAVLNRLSIEQEKAALRADNASAQLREMQKTPQAMLDNLPSTLNEAQQQAKLLALAKDIERLGPINLAAVDEYQQQAQRKTQIEAQLQDMLSGLATLEATMAKIDRQSREQFKATFEQVNQGLQQLFPKVFGGGSAYLALQGDDLLETGVTIMARPPGKKNSTIALLSGGEKALTALSLVFAIFRLNPAPFCMLDEVDAPLDDTNVVRFCNLVQEMSATVQFIYISHNKIAMEMASHLAGVTMYEPGVSRMVAVDIDEAIAMAETS